MIERLFTTTAYIKRYTKVTGTNKMAYTTLSTIKVHIQPRRLTNVTNEGGAISKLFVFWCDQSTDIKEGDLCTINGEEYKVKGVGNYNIGINKHKEVEIERPLQND